MSPEERQLLTALFDRVRTAAATPRDREAEALIDQATREQPYPPPIIWRRPSSFRKRVWRPPPTTSRNSKSVSASLRPARSEHRQAEQGGGFLSSIFGTSQTQQPAQPSGPWGNAPRQTNQDRGYDDSRTATSADAAAADRPMEPSSPARRRPAAASCAARSARRPAWQAACCLPIR